MPVKPNLHAFLLCDQVLRDGTGRCSVIGVFQALKSQSFPLPPRNFSVYLSVSEVVPPMELHLAFKDGQAAKVVQEVRVPLNSAVAPDQAFEINADFHGVVFEHPGDYDFELRAAGSLLGMRTLKVAQA